MTVDGAGFSNPVKANELVQKIQSGDSFQPVAALGPAITAKMVAPDALDSASQTRTLTPTFEPLSMDEVNSLKDLSSGFSMALPAKDPSSAPTTFAPTTAPTDQVTQTPTNALVTKTACPNDCNGNGDCLAGGICACRGGWLRLDCSAFVMKMSILGNTSELSDFGGPTATLTVRVAEIAGILQVPTSLVTCVATCSPSTEAVVQGSKLIFKPNATLVTAKLLGVVSHRTHPSKHFLPSHSMHSQLGLPLGGYQCALMSMATSEQMPGH